MGMISFGCSLLTAFLIFINEGIYKKEKKDATSISSSSGGGGSSGRGSSDYGRSGSSGYNSIGGSGYGSIEGRRGIDNDGVVYEDEYGRMVEEEGYLPSEDYYKGRYDENDYYYNEGYDDYVDDVGVDTVAADQPGYHGNRDGKGDYEI